MLIPINTYVELSVQRYNTAALTQLIPEIISGNGYLDLVLSHSSFISMTSSAISLTDISFGTTIVHSSFNSCSSLSSSAALTISALSDYPIFLSMNCFTDCKSNAEGIACSLKHATTDSKGFISIHQISLDSCGFLENSNAFNMFLTSRGYINQEFINISSCQATRVSAINFFSEQRVKARFINVNNNQQESCCVYASGTVVDLIRCIFTSNIQTSTTHVDKAIVVSTNQASIEVRECCFKNNEGLLLAVPVSNAKIYCTHSYFDTTNIYSGSVTVENKAGSEVLIQYKIVGNRECIGIKPSIGKADSKVKLIIASLLLINYK